MATLTYSRGPGWRASSGSSATAAGTVCSGVSGAATLMAGGSRRSFARRDEVDDREDHDPDDVDEVPVQADQHHGLAPFHRKPAIERHPEQGQEHQDAHGDVRAVEAGE